MYGGPQSYGSLGAGTYYGYANNHVSDGYNQHDSGWDTCPARTIVNPVPATPTGFSSATQNRVWTAGPPSGEVGIEVYTFWSAVPNATKYQVQVTYNDSGAGYQSFTYTVTSTSDYEFYQSSTAIIGSAQVSLRAGNAAGWSGWTSVYTPPTTGQVTQ